MPPSIQSHQKPEYRTLAAEDIDLDNIGTLTLGETRIEIIDPVADYAALMEELFDFDEFLARARKFMPHRPEAHLRYSLTHSLKQTETGKFTWKRDRRARPSTQVQAEDLKQRTAERIRLRWEDVSNISPPTILFRGADSKILSPETADQMIDTLPNGRLAVIADATHNVHSDNPKGFARELDSFLQEVLKLD